MSIYKQPKTDAGKNSAKGLLKVIKLNNNYVLLENQELELTANSITDELKLVYKDGVIIN